jgi:hypothetical protein
MKTQSTIANLLADEDFSPTKRSELSPYGTGSEPDEGVLRSDVNARLANPWNEQPAPRRVEAKESSRELNAITKPNQLMTTTNLDLTLVICSEDGSRTEFFQNDEASVAQTLQQLLAPRLFSQPMLTLASKHSVSAIPSRTVDLILAHTESPPPLPLPPDWLDIVEVNGEAFLENADTEESPEAKDNTVLLAEIHTLGDWMIRLKIETTNRATIQERRQFLAHFFDLPGIPFRLEAGGIGLINPLKISRVTVSPPFKGVPEAALPADLLRCIRS